MQWKWKACYPTGNTRGKCQIRKSGEDTRQCPMCCCLAASEIRQSRSADNSICDVERTEIVRLMNLDAGTQPISSFQLSSSLPPFPRSDVTYIADTPGDVALVGGGRCLVCLALNACSSHQRHQQTTNPKRIKRNEARHRPTPSRNKPCSLTDLMLCRLREKKQQESLQDSR